MSSIIENQIIAIFSNNNVAVRYAAIQNMGRDKMLVTVRGYNATTGLDENVECVVRYVPTNVETLINNHNNK